MYNRMNKRNKNKNYFSNELHLLLLIVVIRTIIKIENFLLLLLLRLSVVPAFSGTNVNVVSIDKSNAYY